MKLKNVFVNDLSLTIKIVVFDSTKEVENELAALQTDISSIHYQSWALETCIVGMVPIFSKLVERSGADPTILNELKALFYSLVLKENPLLDPNNLYINSANLITLNSGVIKLTESATWAVKEDRSDLMVLNITDCYRIMDHARQFEHYIEVVPWELIPDILLCVRKFDKSLKIDLLHGQNPKTEDDVKYFVVVACIDNFQVLYQHIAQHPISETVGFNHIIYSLYDIAIQANPFLKVTTKDFENINKNYVAHKAASSGEPSTETKSARQALVDVPMKEILALEDKVNSKIFGHSNTVSEVCKIIKRARLELKNPNTPIGAVYFYGGTSTGKTELARVFARLLTKSTNGLVKIPCNTLISSHNLHTLLGAPPGYVGYEEKGLLEKHLTSSPFKVVLFDEVEKASSKVFEVVLEMLEEGQCLMANGKVVDMRNCLIIFTSNLGQAEASKATNLAGFSSVSEEDEDKDRAEKAMFEKTLGDTLKPEFLARLNGIFYFKKLSDEDLLKAARSMLTEYSKLLKSKNIVLTIGETVPQYIINECKKKHNRCHARDIKNFIDLQLITMVGDFLVSKMEFNKASRKTIKLSVVDSQLIINSVGKAKG